MKKSAVLFLTVVLFSSMFYFFNSGLELFSSGLFSYIFLAISFSAVFILFRFWNYKFLVLEPSSFGLTKPYITIFSIMYGILSVLFIFLMSLIVKGTWTPKVCSVFSYLKIAYKTFLSILITEYFVSGIVLNSVRMLSNKVLAVIFAVVLYFFTVVNFPFSVPEMLPFLIEIVVFRIVMSLIALYLENIWGTVLINFCLNYFYNLFFYESEVSKLFFDCIRYCLYLSLLAIFIILLVKKRNDETMYW